MVPYDRIVLPQWFETHSVDFRLPTTEEFGEISPTVAITYEWEFSPVFMPQVRSEYEMPWDQIETAKDIVNCLGLAANARTTIVKMWWANSDERLPIKFDPIAFNDPMWLVGSVDKPMQIEKGPLQQVVENYLSFGGNVDALRTALERLNRARRAWRYNDQAIDLGIALESILTYSPRAGDAANQEIGLRLGLRGAWLLGKTSTERRQVFDHIRKIYDLRSRGVHGRDIRNASDWSEPRRRLNDGAVLVSDLIRAVLARRAWPDWTQLILGDQ